ncbi:unnamed protein product [Ambrosiozyma monospora]|uniref:Unnamed protein product n=1 Tax=Ambrosiozyma monospora TaxID=43982 RepID=A0A9W6Z014_AMBMO|nr:unnamed protein product [Ambrosiozyma monospora]
MNVLTNDAIQNPTAVEMRVKKEIRERKKLHEKINQERALTKEEKLDKLKVKHERDLKKGYYSAVFTVKRLVNKQHAFKVDINAKQMNLTGLCLNLTEGQSLIIVEGSELSVNKYKKLMLNRINWTQNVMPKKRVKVDDMDMNMDIDIDDSTDFVEDLSKNKCEMLWEGQLTKLHFQKWTMYNFDDDLDILDLLAKYKLDNYWRQVIASSV